MPEIFITDMYWDRIYLHIKLQGENLESRQFFISTGKHKYKYPVKFNPETSELVINITNISNGQMLVNGKWYIRLLNDDFELEMADYEVNYANYLKALKLLKRRKLRKLAEKPFNYSEDDFSPETEFDFEPESTPEGAIETADDDVLQKPVKPRQWHTVPATLELCQKLDTLDKIFRYSGNNYAYTMSFSVFKRGDFLFITIQSTFMMKNKNPEKRYFNVESSKPKNRRKKRLIYYLEKFINVVYKFVSVLSVKKGNRILIMSETRDFGGNLKALDNRIKERGLDKQFRITYYFSKTLESSRAKIFFIWLKLALLTAKQDFIFVDDYVPFFKYINLDKKTKLIQVWHAGVGFKSVGYARFGAKGSPYPLDSSHRKYTHAIVGGEALRDVYAEVFGIDRENCLPFGLMRNDNYLNPDKIAAFKEKFYSEHPQLKNKKIILFAPTFRGVGQRNAFYPYKILEQDKIFDMCGDEYVFLIKMHPFILKKIEIEEQYSSRIIDFSSYPDINELFYVTDILITDFSSNIYEFAMLNRPIISFAYDKDEYQLIRSVHRTLEKHAPGKICTTIDELVEAIKTKDFETHRLKKFIEENFDNTEGLASDKVIDYFLLGKNQL